MLKLLHTLLLLSIAIAVMPGPSIAQSDAHFNRISSFAVCRQVNVECNTDIETVAEISAVSADGMTLIYTDGPMEQIGFVDITVPSQPQAAGVLGVGGEPTSVAVAGDYALASVNTSTDFVDVSGELVVVEIASQSIVHTLTLPGQPDSIAVSPDGSYLAIVLENEHDEDLGDGAPSQLPAGSLLIVDMLGAPADWNSRRVALTGLADHFAQDPEPEYVDINTENIAVITLQENN